ncbi:non-specific lipid transfer protein GPI-anchored 11-like [Tasmannia lanceolata]|uniref:non-specific lipid transfer protein GPI-anchored 11-like n=1 Tax=Tasmannia lanceolata TaxID=3420 RepID=UPI004063457B
MSAQKMVLIFVTMVFAFFMTFSGVSAQAPAPAPDCFSVLLNLSDCLTYVTPGSNETRPDKGCCPSLAGLVANSPFCLCQLLGNSSGLGFSVNLTRALGLPNVCRVSTPPLSLCSLLGVPISSPTLSPGPASGISPSASGMTPASGISPSASGMTPGTTSSMAPGSPAAPSPTNNEGASSFKVSSLVFLLGLLGAIAIIF